MSIDLPDIQSGKPSIQTPIHQVGVENIVVPFQLESKYGGYYQLMANVSMRTDISSEIRGISMSRFLRTLQKFLDLPLKHKLIHTILKELRNSVESSSSFMKFSFKFPINKIAPVSKEHFPIYYNCRFEGQLLNINNNDVFRFYQGVVIPYSSYCPCSAELCKTLEGKEGFPHNQRSYADVLIEVKEPHYVWLEDIVDIVESKRKVLP